ncbi:MAG: lipopolysaccharide biosynthesis protein, partial [Bacteroidota bacterium]
QSLLKLGKYTTLNLLGTYLLKSLDVLLLGIWLGPAAVGVYHVALKWMEVAEVFVRSFSTAALPHLAQLVHQKNFAGARTYFHRMVGYQYLLVLPLVAGMALMAPWLVQLIAGPGYPTAVPLLRCFCLATLWLPLDRFLGIALDMLGEPRKNTLKILAMVLLNGLGDVWILQTSGSLTGVALVTTANVLLGVGLGYAFLRPYFRVSGREIIIQAKQGLQTLVRHTLSPAHS